MAGKELSEILKNSNVLPAEEIPRLFELFLEYKKESEKTRANSKKHEAKKEVMIREITEKYSLYEALFTRIFAERQAVIKKDFEIIDKGMKENNRDLVQIGVSGLSGVVSSSPVADMDSLRRMIGTAKG